MRIDKLRETSSIIEFEWNDKKALDNARKHGVSFERATKAFLDPFGVEWIDDLDD